MYKVPKSPTWCSRCIAGGATADGAPSTPCDDHRAERGGFADYTGPDAYEPSSWVREVVGGRYTAGDWGNENGGELLVYVCQGTTRGGFWMRRVDEGSKASRRPLVNVGERAVGRTFHEAHMKWGSWILLQEMRRLGRSLTVEEAEDACVGLDLATQTLKVMGLVSGGALTGEGWALPVPEGNVVTDVMRAAWKVRVEEERVGRRAVADGDVTGVKAASGVGGVDD